MDKFDNWEQQLESIELMERYGPELEALAIRAVEQDPASDPVGFVIERGAVTIQGLGEEWLADGGRVARFLTERDRAEEIVRCVAPQALEHLEVDPESWDPAVRVLSIVCILRKGVRIGKRGYRLP